MTTPPHPDVGRIATDPDAFEEFYRGSSAADVGSPVEVVWSGGAC